MPLYSITSSLPQALRASSLGSREPGSEGRSLIRKFYTALSHNIFSPSVSEADSSLGSREPLSDGGMLSLDWRDAHVGWVS